MRETIANQKQFMLRKACRPSVISQASEEATSIGNHQGEFLKPDSPGAAYHVAIGTFRRLESAMGIVYGRFRESGNRIAGGSET